MRLVKPFGGYSEHLTCLQNVIAQIIMLKTQLKQKCSTCFPIKSSATAASCFAAAYLNEITCEYMHDAYTFSATSWPVVCVVPRIATSAFLVQRSKPLGIVLKSSQSKPPWANCPKDTVMGKKRSNKMAPVRHGSLLSCDGELSHIAE